MFLLRPFTRPLGNALLPARLNIKYGFGWAGKIEHFSKVS